MKISLPRFLLLVAALLLGGLPSIWAQVLVFPVQARKTPPVVELKVLKWSISPDSQFALAGRPHIVRNSSGIPDFSGTEYVIVRLSDQHVLPYPGQTEGPLGTYLQGEPTNGGSKCLVWSSDSSLVALAGWLGQVHVYSVTGEGLVDTGFKALGIAEILQGRFPKVTPVQVYKGLPTISAMELLEGDRISISMHGRYGGSLVTDPSVLRTCLYRSTIVYSYTPKMGPKVLSKDVYVEE